MNLLIKELELAVIGGRLQQVVQQPKPYEFLINAYFTGDTNLKTKERLQTYIISRYNCISSLSSCQKYITIILP